MKTKTHLKHETYLRDRLYASVTASTDSLAQTDHRLSVNCDGNEINLHFYNLYLAVSPADWDRIVAAVQQVLPVEETPTTPTNN